MTSNPAAAPNVWTQMGYCPPRGKCNFNRSFMSSGCPCLRFMLHPLKSNSSFECDGCGHHASFHTFENIHEDRMRQLYKEMEELEKKSEEKKRARKRRRALEDDSGNESNTCAGSRLLEAGNLVGDDESENRIPGVFAQNFNTNTRSSNSRGRGTRTTRGRASRTSTRRSKGTITEASESEYQEVVEVD